MTNVQKGILFDAMKWSFLLLKFSIFLFQVIYAEEFSRGLFFCWKEFVTKEKNLRLAICQTKLKLVKQSEMIKIGMKKEKNELMT